MRSAILAGGAASRFDGEPKGLKKVGGERILDRVVRSVRIATEKSPLIIANAADAKEWVPDCEVIPDLRLDCGSLGGIFTAVSRDDSPVLVIAWDMPFVSGDLLKALVTGSRDLDAYLPEGGDRSGLEPTCAVYGPACRPHIEAQLDDEDYRAAGFVNHVNFGTLSLEEIEKIGDPETLFFNVNTQDDLEKAEALWRTRPE